MKFRLIFYIYSRRRLKDSWFPSAKQPYPSENFCTALLVRCIKVLLAGESVHEYSRELNLTYPSLKTYPFILDDTRTHILISNLRFMMSMGFYRYFWTKNRSVLMIDGPRGMTLMNWLPSNVDYYRFYFIYLFAGSLSITDWWIC